MNTALLIIIVGLVLFGIRSNLKRIDRLEKSTRAYCYELQFPQHPRVPCNVISNVNGVVVTSGDDPCPHCIPEPRVQSPEPSSPEPRAQSQKPRVRHFRPRTKA